MKKVQISLLLVIILLLTVSCTAKKQPDEEQENAAAVTGDRIPVGSWEISGDTMQLATTIMDDYLFYLEGDWAPDYGGYLKSSVYMQEGAAGEGKKIAEFEEDIFIKYLVGEDKSIYCFYKGKKDEANYHLRKFGNDGIILYDVSVTEPEDGSGQDAFQRIGTISMGQVSREGEVYFYNEYGDIYMFDAKGRLVHIVSAGWDRETYCSDRCGLVNAGKEGIYSYVIEDEEVTLQKINLSESDTQEELRFKLEDQDKAISDPTLKTMENRPGSLEIYNGYDMGILISDSESLWKYDITEGKLDKVLGWGDSTVNLKGYIIDGIGVLDNNDLYIMAHQSYSDVVFVTIDYKNTSEIAQKQTITMGLIKSYTTACEVSEAMAADFNRQSNDVEIAFQYYESIVDLQLQLIKGEGPDLLNLDDMDIIVLADKGILEDLSPYFVRSDKVKETDLLPSILRACTVRGKLACAISSYQVNGFWVEKGTTKGSAWTVDNYITLGENARETPLMDDNPEYFHSDILRIVMQADMDSYVNWDKRECYFNTEEFINLVNRVKDLPPPEKMLDFYAKDDSFLQNEVLTRVFNMNSIRSDELIEMNGGLADGELFEVAGYPNKNGVPAFNLITMEAYGINSASEKKEEAWAFLEFILSEEHQNKEKSFPARIDALERQLAVEKYPYTDIEFSDEDREFIRMMIDHLYWSGASRAIDISVMISEELSPVWKDARTAEDAVEIIQERVMLYLHE